MGLTIVVPAYNEERNLEKNIKSLKDACEELIVVDDGSTDKTADVAKAGGARVIRNGHNMGKGFSVKMGLLAAKQDKVMFMDADLATPVSEVAKLRKSKAKVAIGSRYLKESDADRRTGRKLGSKIFNLAVRVITFLPFSDTQCGCKLLRKSVARKIARKMTVNGWAFDIELLTIARRNGYSVEEIPITWQEQKTSHLTFGDACIMLLQTLRIRWNDLTGKYR